MYGKLQSPTNPKGPSPFGTELQCPRPVLWPLMILFNFLFMVKLLEGCAPNGSVQSPLGEGAKPFFLLVSVRFDLTSIFLYFI